MKDYNWQEIHGRLMYTWLWWLVEWDRVMK